MISAWKDISAIYIWGREKKSQTKHWFSVWTGILNNHDNIWKTNEASICFDEISTSGHPTVIHADYIQIRAAYVLK